MIDLLGVRLPFPLPHVEVANWKGEATANRLIDRFESFSQHHVYDCRRMATLLVVGLVPINGIGNGSRSSIYDRVKQKSRLVGRVPPLGVFPFYSFRRLPPFSCGA